MGDFRGMSHFQVAAILGNGAMVLFGVAAGGETGALLAATERLSRFGQKVDQVQLLELPQGQHGGRKP